MYEITSDVQPPEDNQESYGRADINKVFEEWNTWMGYQITVKMVQNRRFANTLIKREGLPKVLEYIVVASAARSDRFGPRITSIIDLYYRWDRLTDWGLRQQQSRADDIVVELG